MFIFSKKKNYYYFGIFTKLYIFLQFKYFRIFICCNFPNFYFCNYYFIIFSFVNLTLQFYSYKKRVIFIFGISYLIALVL